MKYEQKLLRVQLAGNISQEGAIAFVRMWDVMQRITDEEKTLIPSPVVLLPLAK